MSSSSTLSVGVEVHGLLPRIRAIAESRVPRGVGEAEFKDFGQGLHAGFGVKRTTDISVVRTSSRAIALSASFTAWVNGWYNPNVALNVPFHTGCYGEGPNVLTARLDCVLDLSSAWELTVNVLPHIECQDLIRVQPIGANVSMTVLDQVEQAITREAAGSIRDCLTRAAPGDPNTRQNLFQLHMRELWHELRKVHTVVIPGSAHRLQLAVNPTELSLSQPHLLNDAGVLRLTIGMGCSPQAHIGSGPLLPSSSSPAELPPQTTSPASSAFRLRVPLLASFSFLQAQANRQIEQTRNSLSWLRNGASLRVVVVEIDQGPDGPQRLRLSLELAQGLATIPLTATVTPVYNASTHVLSLADPRLTVGASVTGGLFLSMLGVNDPTSALQRFLQRRLQFNLSGEMTSTLAALSRALNRTIPLRLGNPRSFDIQASARLSTRLTEGVPQGPVSVIVQADGLMVEIGLQGSLDVTVALNELTANQLRDQHPPQPPLPFDALQPQRGPIPQPPNPIVQMAGVLTMLGVDIAHTVASIFGTGHHRFDWRRQRLNASGHYNLPPGVCELHKDDSERRVFEGNGQNTVHLFCNGSGFTILCNVHKVHVHDKNGRGTLVLIDCDLAYVRAMDGDGGIIMWNPHANSRLVIEKKDGMGRVWNRGAAPVVKAMLNPHAKIGSFHGDPNQPGVLA